MRCRDFRESSKIVECYTRDYGKVTLVAKGAKRPKSRLGGAVDLLNRIELVFYYKETREIQTLSQAEILDAFEDLRGDLRQFSIAVSLCEFLDAVEAREHPNVRLYSQLVQSLEELSGVRQPELVLYQFVWRWLSGAGFRPRFRRCMACGRQPDRGPVQFAIGRGGFFCANCRRPESTGRDLSLAALRLLLWMRDRQVSELKGIKADPDTIAEVEHLTWEFLRYHTETTRPLRSLSFLRKIGQDEKERREADVQSTDRCKADG